MAYRCLNTTCTAQGRAQGAAYEGVGSPYCAICMSVLTPDPVYPLASAPRTRGEVTPRELMHVQGRVQSIERRIGALEAKLQPQLDSDLYPPHAQIAGMVGRTVFDLLMHGTAEDLSQLARLVQVAIVLRSHEAEHEQG